LNWLNLLGIAIGLAMDAFAVCIVAGMTLNTVTPRQTFRLAFHFGLFQFMMPILGWLAGNSVARYIVDYDHWLAFGLLACVGGKMLLEARRRDTPSARADPSRGWMLVTLSVATSIDALAVGLSMAFIGVSIWIPSVVIGLVAAAMSVVGLRFGTRLGSQWGHRAEFAGGCILILIGTRILISHLTA
jgi:manganese efflux pump family protein